MKFIYHKDIVSISKLILFISCFMMISCSTNCKEESYYYDTGELWVEEKLVDKKDSIYSTKIFNKKGYLEKEGYTDKFQNPIGLWIEYFADGKVKWKGEIKDKQYYLPDSLFLNMHNQYSYIEIEGSPRYLKKGNSYKMRTYVEGVPSTFYEVTDSMGYPFEFNKEDPENYVYVFTPNERGVFEIWIMFPDSSGYIVPKKSRAKLFSISVY